MKIRLHIDRLVLHGIDLPRHQQILLQAAVASELTRLLASDSEAFDHFSSGSIPHLQAADIQIPPAGPGKITVGRLGNRIAKSVYKRINT
jgi:hypothetical protein